MNKRTCSRKTDGPAVAGLSRRDFLRLAGAAAAAAGVLPASAYAADPPAGETPRGETRTVTVLSKNPTRNPGFNVRELPDQGLLVWARRSERDLRAYRMNGFGRCVWGLCDGKRDAAGIAAEYEKLTRRAGREADDFLSSLLKLGVVASGAKVVAIGDVSVKG